MVVVLSMTTDEIIAEVIEAEGGYVDNPADKGGPTRYGITAATLGAWRKLGRDATAAEVQDLPLDEAHLIYRRRYVEDPGFDSISGPRTRALIVDCGVLHGPRNAVRLLQRALGMTEKEVDGLLGDATRSKANAWEDRRLAVLVLAERFIFIGRLISKDLTDKDKDGIPDNTEFASGWLNRFSKQLKALA